MFSWHPTRQRQRQCYCQCLVDTPRVSVGVSVSVGDDTFSLSLSLSLSVVLCLTLTPILSRYMTTTHTQIHRRMLGAAKGYSGTRSRGGRGARQGCCVWKKYLSQVVLFQVPQHHEITPLSILGCHQQNLVKILSDFKWAAHRSARILTYGWLTASHIDWWFLLLLVTVI